MSDMAPTASAPGSPPRCRGCSRYLRALFTVLPDGCPCNSARGMNHGLVDPLVCTCAECDPAQTGASRWPEGRRRVSARLMDERR